MRHVIVTGGSRGIGIALVKHLLSNGYRVTTCSRASTKPLDALRRTHDGRLDWTAFRIGEDDPETLVAAAAKQAAGDELWGLVNNAAITGEGVLATFPLPEIEKIIDVNLVGVLGLTRSMLRALLRQGGHGRIVNITSIVGLRGYSGLAAYAAAKAGVDGMTRALAREVGPKGITVNSVAPGYLKTELSAGISDAQLQQIARRTPLRRLATVDDIVPVIAFLLSDEAGFISGQTLVVDGGLTC